MTGIFLPNNGRRAPKDEPPSKQYDELKKVPETYSIIQFGISLFHYTGGTSATNASGPQQRAAATSTDTNSSRSTPREDTTNSRHSSESNGATNEAAASPDWTVRRYNFFSFPSKDSDRSVVLNPSTVAFLHQHNISFDQWTKEGIPFQTHAKADDTLKHYLKQHSAAVAAKRDAEKQPTTEDVSRRHVRLSRTDDLDFFSRAMAGLRGWLDSPVPPEDQQEEKVEEGTCFLMPDCNAFLRRALYESIQKEYPSLILEKAPNSHRIRVLRLSDEEKERRELRLQTEAWNNLIVEQVGLYRIFHALSQVARGFSLERDSALLAPSVDDIDFDKELSLYRGPKERKIPIIVHNGFMDLCFLLSHFVCPQLPDTLTECKHLIRKYFPVIYDTKIMALEYGPTMLRENTRLGVLYQRIKDRLGGTIHVLQPTTPENGGGTTEQASTSLPEEEHFADYDAFMTGTCFLGLCEYILRTTDQSSNAGAAHSSGVVAKPQVGPLENLLAPVLDPQIRKSFGRNLLYQMSMFNLDLEDGEKDPLSYGYQGSSIYRVLGINSSVTTRDIFHGVSRFCESQGRRVNFEIIWIDDTTFMVAVCRPNNGGTNEEAILAENGQLVEDALKRRFTDAIVITFEEHMRNVELGLSPNAKKETLASKASKFLLGWIGIQSNKDQEGPSNKRRRIA